MEPRDCPPPVITNRRWYFDTNEEESTTLLQKRTDKKLADSAERSWDIESDDRSQYGNVSTSQSVVRPQTSPLRSSKTGDGTEVGRTEEKKTLGTEEEKTLEQENSPYNKENSPDRVESAIDVLQKGISSTIYALDHGHLTPDHPVTFKNPVPNIGKRQQSRNEEILSKHTTRRKPLDPYTTYQDPTPQVDELIQGALSESSARRSNACGTLKLMASQKKNAPMLCTAKGLLDALLHASKRSETETDQTIRNRALATISLLSQAKETRRVVCEHEKVLVYLSEIVKADEGEARLHACSTVAALAKTEENRDMLMDTDKTLVREFSRILVKGKESGEGGAPLSKSAHKILLSTRLNVCAALLHLSKQCTVSVKMCADKEIVGNIASSCLSLDDPVHTRCMEALCNLTRFPGNVDSLLENKDVIVALSTCGMSNDRDDRLLSLRAMQNMSAHATKRVTVATEDILQLLCSSAEKLNMVEEHEAAISVLGNFCTDPNCIVQLTNSENVVRVLVTVANNIDYDPEIQFVACDALATIAMWLQRLARGGSVPEGFSFEPLPTLKSTGYMRYNTRE